MWLALNVALAHIFLPCPCPNLPQVSLAIAFAVLVFAEIVRCSGVVPSVSTALHRFMSGFADERDSGPVFMTHLALLLGIAVPIWLGQVGLPMPTLGVLGSPRNSSTDGLDTRADPNIQESISRSKVSHQDDGALAYVWLMVSCGGMLCLGLGDTAASVVGVLYGRCGYK